MSIPFFFAYTISSLLGWLVMLTLNREAACRPALAFFLSLGLGLGLSGEIAFYSFLLAGRFDPSLLLTIHLSLGLLLLILNLKNLIAVCKRFRPASLRWTQGLGAGALLVLMFHAVYMFATTQPFGQWDAWAVWNMKAKFLVFGGKNWAELFKLHWHTQPDYPLLLPLINAWAFSIPLNGFNFVPALTGMLLTIACPGLLYAGLSRYISAGIAFVCAMSLFLLPIFTAMGISQYADMLLAYYLLAAIVLLTMTLKEKSPGTAALLGLILGIMAFGKNEGILISFLISGLAGLYLLLEKAADRKTNIKVLVFLFLGLLVTMPPTVILKLLLAPPNRDIGVLTFGCMKFLNLHSLGVIAQQLGAAFLNERFMFIWGALAVMFLAQPRRYFYKETKTLTFFFLIYMLCIIWVYLTTVNFDLEWRMSRTVVRILMVLLPAAVFLHFYAYWRRDNSH